MKKPARFVILLILSAAVLTLFTWMFFTIPSRPASAAALSPDGSALLSASQQFTETYSYLPAIFNKINATSIFGVQLEPINNPVVINLTTDAGLYWVRRNGLTWDTVEPVQGGGYDWSLVGFLDQDLVAAYENGLHVILVIRATPSWAQLYPGVTCGPMQQQYFDEFANFLAAAVARYSAPPYYVEYFEIWNEPDVDPDLIPPFEIYGCWGDNSDAYYGGGYYGEMLKAVYPSIKVANPNAKVLIGGLLLDCDPRNPPAGQTCKPSKFLEGILLAGAKNSFDGVSFHAYDYYNWVDDTYGNPNWNSGKFNNEPNGVMSPVMSMKLGFINQVLAQYNVTGKFLMNTEVALVCGGANDPPGLPGCDATDGSPYEQMKKAYAAQAFTVAGPLNLDANVWFSMTGWRNSGLVYPGNTPRPAYFAVDFAQEMLWEAIYTGRVLGYSDVTGYKFYNPEISNLWVMWATDGNSQTITLPSTPLAIWDSTGNVVAVTGSSVTLTIDPYYIQMP